MRLIQVSIPSGKREAVLGVLDEEGIDYALSEETSGREFEAIVSFPVPRQAVEPVLEQLREVGIDADGYTVVLEANTVISRQFEKLEQRYAEDDDSERIAREELVESARSMAPPLPTYVMLTVVSAVIATAGLLLDSPAVVVGSMVIAPLVGPAMSASVATVVDEDALFRRGIKLQVLGVVLSVVSAAAFAAAVRYLHLIPPISDVTAVGQIRERVAPDFLSLVVALGAGVAGVLSLASGVSTALVGVMIAVALIPPAATVGIGIAWGQPYVAIGAGVLVLVNVLSINLAALVTLYQQGYRPYHWFRQEEVRALTIKRVGVLVVAILVLSAFLGGVTYDSFDRSQTTDEVHAAATDIAAANDVRILSTATEFSNGVIFQHLTHVVVRVGTPPGTDPPDLAKTFDERFEAIGNGGGTVRTEVQYVPIGSA